MRLNKTFLAIHERIVSYMASLSWVEKYLIATVEEENGEIYDCIYCTILRNAVLFACVGGVVGGVVGYLLGSS